MRWGEVCLTAWIREDLPVLLKRVAAEKNGQEDGDPGRKDQAEADVDANLEVSKALLEEIRRLGPPGATSCWITHTEAQIEGAHGGLQDPEKKRVS
jgi:hypothetical protein